ncbi:E3 ubiquitin-protein ligase RNF31 [Latimeria chalumnae]|uniref:E3 ubiquitin-protein ligase RNF31 n=1 Tax=Latimeria chalumnae TaxID=7897 RepID=UPI0003C197B6|nr:PREDICTED: E3 ubiquitin-protein ligase RNF31 [Latimeria chalumnae]|eukprot:XP_006010093.1 PREDICTED: E3 ubiquitin-protein ligase RNF31 [Latimeria chalumnae]
MAEDGKKEEYFLELRQEAVGKVAEFPGEPPRELLGKMAAAQLPLKEKYCELDAAHIIKVNFKGTLLQNLRVISTAFNILEKYGCNLLNPFKPKYWRSVKFNNPVFKSTVDAIMGGRNVLQLYGYSEEQTDGLAFPEDVAEPDISRVASVTVDVMLLRMELDQLLKGTHVHPEIFYPVIPREVLHPASVQAEVDCDSIPFTVNTTPPTGTLNKASLPPVQSMMSPVSVTTPGLSSMVGSQEIITSPQEHTEPPPDPGSALLTLCALCGEASVSTHCPSCVYMLCAECDVRYHKHPARSTHVRLPVQRAPQTRVSSQNLEDSSFESPPKSPRVALLHSIAGGDLQSFQQHPLGTQYRTKPQEGQTAVLGSLSPPSPLYCPKDASREPGRSFPVTEGNLSRSFWRGLSAEPLEFKQQQSPLPRPPWHCVGCYTLNEARSVLCVACDRPRGCKSAPSLEQEDKSLSSRGRWSCQACTFENESAAVLCSVCERPRLAGKPPVKVDDERLSGLQFQNAATVQPSFQQALGWECEHCTYFNTKPGRICEMCDRTSTVATGQLLTRVPTTLVDRVSTLEQKLKRGLEQSSQPTSGVPGQAKMNSKADTRNQDEDWLWQEQMRARGQKLVQMIREGEKNGVSPEDVYCAVRYSGTEVPVQWLRTELPHVLETIADLATQKGAAMVENTVGVVRLEEARLAWRACEGNIEDAVQECVTMRRRKFQELKVMGFSDREEVLQSLYINGGDVSKALTDLQRKLLEPFHQHIWEELDPPIRIDRTDRQRLLRQILAVYNLPSWGRAELVLSLAQEREGNYDLHDVVEAVKQSHDKHFIKRMLSQECAVCFYSFPRNRMQSLTSCECTICPDCFKQYFTITVKEKNIKDLVCPQCSKPEISDEGELLNYFSTLDIQLRDCLDKDAYDLFHKKLTERTLMNDPKFVWCSHCSFGFIYDGDQLKVTCLQCKKSFCIKCKRPWEVQHQGITCEEFQNWKRENDPEYQAQGLAAYLKENGIICPHCKFAYALARGGCMHFNCSQCRHEFCSGCYNTFAKNDCTFKNCTMGKTLHAHHPRDCLFYLRDWDVARLQVLLKKDGVNFNMEPPHGTQAAPGGGCRVLEQKELPSGVKDEPCAKVTPAGYAGLCISHYKEYLVSLINDHMLDPAPLYDLKELETVCQRYRLGLAPQAQGEDEAAYLGRLLAKLTTEVPLGDKIPRKRK